MVDLHTVLQPLVDQPGEPPRPVDEIAHDAQRRQVRRRRRTVAAASGAAALVVVVAVGTLAAQDSPERVTTVDQPTTSALEPTTSTSASSTTTTPPPLSSSPPVETTATTTPVTSMPAVPPATGQGCATAHPVPRGSRGPFDTIEAESYDARQGVVTAPLQGGAGCQVGAGDSHHVMFHLDFGEALATRFEARVASPGDEMVLEARLDAPDSPPFATIRVTGTGGLNRFTTFTDDTSAAIGGQHAVYVTFTSAQGSAVVAVDWFRFQP